ncbi:MAG: guanylate kinase [Pseudonocardiales bacterium]|nr:guanylate kinase [Actinomycetota bacterium]PZS15669.1 MAG: guanylate kinase [Pseudonocardiales bacterium]
MTVREPGPGAVVRPRLTVVSGPSGVGKSSVVAEVVWFWPQLFVSVSMTTRAPRGGERPDEHYHYVDRAIFARMIERGEFLEYAEYAGNFYGTPVAPLRAALAIGRSTLLEIEVQGARQVRAAMPEALLVMLVPPSWEVLDGRLSDRGTEDPAERECRLRVARAELDAVGEFDATVVNDDVRRAALELINLMGGTVGRTPPTRPR